MINVLIVEDEPGLADVHSYFLQQVDGFRAVSIAGSIEQAEILAKTLKPQLILLDNFLPDGEGISVMAELKHLSGADVIFITAANEMATIRQAISLGVFDYLVKPICYDRLQASLKRYLKFHQTVKKSGQARQSQIDDLLNLQASAIESGIQDSGIDETTLTKVMSIFSHLNVEFSAEGLAKELGMSKTTARRYLDYCTRKGKLAASLEHGKVGRPVRIYSLPMPTLLT